MQENSISLLTDYLITTFLSRKSILDAISAYSSIHSKTFTLCEERNLYEISVNEAFEKMKHFQNEFQFETFFRKSSKEVQYFILERLSLIRYFAPKLEPNLRLFLDPSKVISNNIPISHHGIGALLEVLWINTKVLIGSDARSTDQLVSDIVRFS